MRQATFTLGASSRDLALIRPSSFPEILTPNLIMTNWSSQMSRDPQARAIRATLRAVRPALRPRASTIGSAMATGATPRSISSPCRSRGAQRALWADSSRLWHAPQNIGRAMTAEFLTYSLDLTAGFNSSAVLTVMAFTCSPRTHFRHGHIPRYLPEQESADPYQFYTFDFTSALMATGPGTITTVSLTVWRQPIWFGHSRSGTAYALLMGIGVAGLGLRRKFGKSPVKAKALGLNNASPSAGHIRRTGFFVFR